MKPEIPTTIDPALGAQLAADAPGPFDVTVIFTRDLSAAELSSLGLEGNSALGYGQLERSALLALARRADVASIEARAAASAGSSKLSSALSQELLRTPGQSHHVYVTFSALPDRAELERWSLSADTASGQLGIARGRLTQEQIQTLAARGDVAFIEIGSTYYLAR